MQELGMSEVVLTDLEERMLLLLLLLQDGDVKTIPIILGVSSDEIETATARLCELGFVNTGGRVN